MSSSNLDPQEAISVQSVGGSSSKMPSPCYLLVADILGFSQMITNLTDDEQRQRIREWIDLVQTTKLEVGTKDTQLISDTLFVRADDSDDGLKQLLQFAQLLLQKGIERSFPIRGAIVNGNVVWGKLTYGLAVIQAHKIERSLDWIGIACSPSLPRIDRFWSWDLVVVYPPPENSNKRQWLYQLMPVVAWNVPLAEELTNKAICSGLFKPGERIPSHVIRKIERTVQFGMYLRLGKSLRSDPQRFHGLFPMQFIESWSEAFR